MAMTGENIRIEINPQARVRLTHVGDEENSLLIVDDVVLNPDILIDAAAGSRFLTPEGTFYPGLNAALPDAYLQTLVPVLRPSLMRAFGVGDAALNVHGFLALSTKQVADMVPLQKIPHYDQPDPRALAMVHYLCRDQGGGTGFFRHDTTGFESISPERRAGYMDIVVRELDAAAPHLTAYTGPDTPNYTLLEAVELRFNRLILYRSNMLHCALFNGARLSDDPRTGRLTANAFFMPE